MQGGAVGNKLTIEVRILEKRLERPGHSETRALETFDAWDSNVRGNLVSRQNYVMAFGAQGQNMTATFWMDPTVADKYDACIASAYATVDGAPVHHNYTITRLP